MACLILNQYSINHILDSTLTRLIYLIRFMNSLQIAKENPILHRRGASTVLSLVAGSLPLFDEFGKSIGCSMGAGLAEMSDGLRA